MPYRFWRIRPQNWVPRFSGGYRRIRRLALNYRANLGLFTPFLGDVKKIQPRMAGSARPPQKYYEVEGGVQGPVATGVSRVVLLAISPRNSSPPQIPQSLPGKVQGRVQVQGLPEDKGRFFRLAQSLEVDA